MVGFSLWRPHSRPPSRLVRGQSFEFDAGGAHFDFGLVIHVVPKAQGNRLFVFRQDPLPAFAQGPSGREVDNQNGFVHRSPHDEVELDLTASLEPAHQLGKGIAVKYPLPALIRCPMAGEENRYGFSGAGVGVWLSLW